MTGWYERPSLAFGDQADVLQCSRVFRDVSTAMQIARPRAMEFQQHGDDIWAGSTADQFRDELDLVPELLRRAAIANGEVASALGTFAPRLAEYQRRLAALQSDGRSTVREIDAIERQRDAAVARLRSEETDPFGYIGGLFTGYEGDPEVHRLTTRLQQLHDELLRAERHYDDNEDAFESAVAIAADLIGEAENVLYNNGWDKFWTQTLEPVLEVVKLVLEIAAVVLMVVAIFTGVGALLALIVGALLLAISATQVIGTAAAGREVTAEMWFDLAVNAAAVLTMGTARWAKGLKIAGKGSKSAGQILKAGRRVNYVGKASRAKYAGKLPGLAEQSARFEKWEQATRWARRAEQLEGAVNVGDGAYKISEGDELGGVASIVGGASGATLGRGETGMGRGGVADDLIQIGAGGIDIGGKVGEFAGEQAERSAADGERESPSSWPGLDGLREGR